VDSFYDQSIRENHRKEWLKPREAKDAFRDYGSNRTDEGAGLTPCDHEAFQRRQKNFGEAGGARRSKSSNCKKSDSLSNRPQSALAAFCSVNFGLYSRRLFCHSNQASWIGGHGVLGGGKS
jgi:hypothetical protein